MKLPDFPLLTQAQLEAVLTRHHLQGQPLARLPEVGIFNAIFAVGDEVILRVPRHHPVFTAAARKEAHAVPAARLAGVHTPALLAFDDSLELLPVPYSLYERVHGENLERLALEPEATKAAYLALGRDLARLHEGVPKQGTVASLEPETLPRPDLWPTELEAQGYLGAQEARWLSDWMERLRKQAATSPSPLVFRHGDVQASNVMVAADRSYLALLDWGGCGWGEAAHDFAGVPLGAVPLMLEGYQEVRLLPEDGSFEARIVLRQLHLALFLLRRSPQPGRSWAERPLGMMLDLLHGLGKSKSQRFKDLL